MSGIFDNSAYMKDVGNAWTTANDNTYLNAKDLAKLMKKLNKKHKAKTYITKQTFGEMAGRWSIGRVFPNGEAVYLHSDGIWRTSCIPFETGYHSTRAEARALSKKYKYKGYRGYGYSRDPYMRTILEQHNIVMPPRHLIMSSF